jgi:hypothetical protein
MSHLGPLFVLRQTGTDRATTFSLSQESNPQGRNGWYNSSYISYNLYILINVCGYAQQAGERIGRGSAGGMSGACSHTTARSVDAVSMFEVNFTTCCVIGGSSMNLSHWNLMEGIQVESKNHQHEIPWKINSATFSPAALTFNGVVEGVFIVIK